MQSENEKLSISPNTNLQNSAAYSNSKFAQPSANYIRPKTVAAKQRRNEVQKAFYHMEEIVDIQEMLFSLSTQGINGRIRQDFLLGLQGAPRLSHKDFEILQTFHQLISGPRTALQYHSNTPHDANLITSEHFKCLLEGERKPVLGAKGLNYCDGKAIISRILDSGYFKQIRIDNSKVKIETTVQQPATYEESDYENEMTMKVLQKLSGESKQTRLV